MTPDERFDRLDEFSKAALRANGRDPDSRLHCIEWCEAYEARLEEGRGRFVAAMAKFYAPKAFLA